MIIEMQVPSPGESINEVQISRWLKADGDYVNQEEVLCEIESDKATLTMNAESAGVLKILAPAGEMVKVKSVVCTIDTDAKKPAGAKVVSSKEEKTAPKTEAPSGNGYAKGHPSVAAEKMMKEQGVVAQNIAGTGKGGRITKGDVLDAASAPRAVAPVAVPASTAPPASYGTGARTQRREKMTMLRKKLSQRLVAVKNQTAMLTTFNEVDMTEVMAVRKLYKDKFKEVHGVNLGFMSFFTKAVTESLKAFPAVNAMIDGEEIIYHDYADVGIAVSAPKGLMVPVLRNAESMSLAQIEATIAALAGKARDGKISIDEMSGGTFTITNGGVFGSMMSTPILNPPQSAILGMHNIVERPVVISGKIEIRSMMYLALSYDHRIIDGRESVGFLVNVKKMIEDPVKMLFAGNDPMKTLLGL